MKKIFLFALWLSIWPIGMVQVEAAETSRLDRVIQSGKLRICTTGDYKPFSYLTPDGKYEGMDIDLGINLAQALGVTPQFVPTSWKNLMEDFLARCDIAMGGISVTLERQKKAGFSSAHMVDGKTPIIRCSDKQKYPTWEAIDQPDTRAIVNPGGTNERFAHAAYRHAKLMVFPDNVTIFEQIVQGNADVMVTDTSETLWQARQHPELCSVAIEKPLQFAEKAYMLPRDDLAFKAWIDSWMHLQKMNGTYDAVFKKWLK